MTLTEDPGKVVLMRRRFRAKTQLTINHCLVFGDSKPDIEHIIRVTSCPVLIKVVVIDRKVIIAGQVDLTVEYAACAHCNTQPVHLAAFHVPFAHFLDHCGARSGQDAKVSCEIEFQRCQFLNRRTITIFILLKICVFQLEAAKFQTKAAVCPAEQITCCSQEFSPCPQPPVYDESRQRPCSCVSCDC